MGDLHRGLIYAGVAAPLVYVATVVFGGWATVGYSHLSQPVSALFETGAPHALPVSLAFVAYNLLLASFGYALLGQGGRSGTRAAAWMILANGACGLAIELAPMDPMGAPATLPGIVHIVLAALLVLTCSAAMAFMAWAWLQARQNALVATSLVLLLLMLVAGGLAATAASASWPWLGLLQRITIGSYLVWLPIVAVVALRRPLSAA